MRLPVQPRSVLSVARSCIGTAFCHQSQKRQGCLFIGWWRPSGTHDVVVAAAASALCLREQRAEEPLLLRRRGAQP